MVSPLNYHRLIDKKACFAVYFLYANRVQVWCAIVRSGHVVRPTTHLRLRGGPGEVSAAPFVVILYFSVLSW